MSVWRDIARLPRKGWKAFPALPLALLAASALPAEQGQRVKFETTKGDFVIELYSETTPKTVANFLAYVDSGFYADTIFHRVIPKFVVQGGGFTPELTQKPTLPPVPIESKNGLDNLRGSVSMARMDNKDSATSQFFINLNDNEQLDRRGSQFGYTVFGRVVEGMEVIDRIAGVQTSRRGAMENIPILPVIVDSARRVE